MRISRCELNKPEEQEDMDHDRVKFYKVSAGEKFIRIIPKDHIMFCGISGSVSYNPKRDDDIDLFMITEDGFLWRTVMSTFLRRRFHRNPDICLSLVYDHSFAVKYFNEIIDGLPLADSLKVIRVFGAEYYDHLLMNSVRLNKYFRNEERITYLQSQKENRRKFSINPIEVFSFLTCSAVLILKSIFINWKLKRSGDNGSTYKPVLSFHRFVLESERYKAMDREYRNRDHNEP